MDTVITALIVFGALIYMRIHNHSHADYDEDNPKGFDVRAFIFPIHYFIRSTIFNTFKSNGLAFFFVLFVGGYALLLDVPIWYMNRTAGKMFDDFFIF
ncbi:hypothetical protein HRD57_00285 [Tetragenococcus halophilus]|nr:hypothetical protein [Tetragenococcus halophilus]